MTFGFSAQAKHFKSKPLFQYPKENPVYIVTYTYTQSDIQRYKLQKMFSHLQKRKPASKKYPQI
jgi:hypothetical protein